MFAFAMLLAAAGPTVFCPKVSCPGGPTGSGVVIGVKDDFAYVLTAAHVVTFEGVEVRFGSDKGWFANKPEVVKRWPVPDVALVKFRVGNEQVPVRPLAAAGQRPKAFPVAAWAVGMTGETATVWADQVLAKRFVRKSETAAAFFWETERPPEPGRSGGPLVAGGRVIGICTANQGGRGYYTHIDEIHAALIRDGHGWLVPR